jgi:A-macroglobulin receptor binding domain
VKTPDVLKALSRYEVLSDRVVFYLWPKASGASFDFSLQTRMPMQAKSAASVLYDYYNPERSIWFSLLRNHPEMFFGQIAKPFGMAGPMSCLTESLCYRPQHVRPEVNSQYSVEAMLSTD